jgi:UDP-2,3-diacylglucosamine pyrophosphatase LpxH
MYAFIGDLHLGVKLPQIDYLKSLDKFFGLIKSHKEECHCIFVCGDLFDHKLNIDDAKFAAMFMVNLVCNNCGRTRQHVPVHFIHGTDSHDNSQYEIFLPMLEKIPNTEVFYTKTASIGTLRNGKKVLYLPQEYRNVDYTEAFSKSYDIIVGHGPISSKTKSPCKSEGYEIVHSAEQLGDISKICVFGHYHGYTDFGNGVYYTGPWLRWKYGEDEPRVFFTCTDDFKVETCPNEFALEFETIDIFSPEELRTEVSKEIRNPHRFIIHCNNSELNEYHAIMNAYKKNPFVKYRIISDSSSNEDIDKLLASDKTHSRTIIEPVTELIDYVKEKYNEDVSEEVRNYESKIIIDDKKDTLPVST